jgi:hypothetical protein
VSWFSEKLISERRRTLGLAPDAASSVAVLVNSPMRRKPANAIQKAAWILASSLSADTGGRMLLSIVIVIGWRVLFGAGGKTFRAPLMRRLMCALSKTSALKA